MDTCLVRRPPNQHGADHGGWPGIRLCHRRRPLRRGGFQQNLTLMAVAEAIDEALLHLVGDFGGSLFAVTQFMKVFTSDDGGRT
jgi:hypothetical protein